MWSQYDENLEDNPFLREIQEQHSDIIAKATEENWIICVPRLGTYEPDKLSMEIILDHILICSSGENYLTLSKKEITVRNKHIHINNNDCYNGVEILFEETFYMQKAAKYIVWCIDRPLFVKDSLCDFQKSVFLENLHDCVDFLWAESLGHGILDNIRQLSESFVQHQEDIELEDLQTLKELLGELYSQCLQVSFKNEVVKDKGMNSNLFMDNMKVSVETYMQYCLGRKLMFSINTIEYQSDAYLNKIIRNASEIQPHNLGISNKFTDAIRMAKSELSKINNCITVLDKINCIKETFNVLFQKQEYIKDICVTTDEILQILVFLISKLNINNWTANLIYMKEFQFSFSENCDRNSFFITSLEAALEFIKSNSFMNIINDKNINSLNCIETTVQDLHNKIISQEIISLDINNVLKESFENRLCHPLCSCKKCHDIIKTQINDENKESTNFNSRILNDKDQNLLIVASILGYRDVVEFLLEQGFCVDSMDCFSRTSLHYASAKGYQDILLVLINHRANVNAVDIDKNMPLHLACQNGQENCVKGLIYSSAEVELNVSNNFGDTPLHLATKWGYFDIIKVLIENGASVIIKNKRNHTVLNLAPNYHVLKLFQQFGKECSTTLSKQIEDNEISIKENKVNFDHCKDYAIRPKNKEEYKKIDLLLKAIENNDLPLTYFYLGFSSNVLNNLEKSKCHPLCICAKCQTEDTEIVTTSFSLKNVNVNMCNTNGYTPLHYAAKFGRTEILRLLLDCGASPNFKTYKTLYTSLHLACFYQRVQTVRELLKCGDCKIDEYDVEGNTPLYYACENNDIKIVEILLCNGADCNKKNYSGKSPLQESQENMQYRIFKLMKNSLVSNLYKGSLSESCQKLF